MVETRQGILAPGSTAESKLGYSVVNLSNTPLSVAQIQALEKGITFCPSPGPPEITKCWDDLHEFFRRLRITRYFEDVEDTPQTRTPFRLKSQWTPPEGNDPFLDAYIKAVKTHFLTLEFHNTGKPNLRRAEYQGLLKLKTNPEITIKKADKGSAIVVMNTCDYIAEAERQLSNQENYYKLRTDPTTHFSAQIRATIERMLDLDIIDDTTAEYLHVETPKHGRFYMLPKIHKKKIPGRPICSSNGHPTERISEFVDFHIRQYVKQLPTYIRDTQDFITKIRSLGKLPTGSILCTMDVTSLYTCIPNKQGIDAVVEHVRKDPTAKIPPFWIGKLLEHVLHMNYFIFNGEIYLQTGGTAMGTRVAPSLANLFMGRIEHQLLESSEFKPLIFLRFIDDIFLVWCHGEDSLARFIREANSFHPTIKFTAETSKEQIAFLDTLIKIDPVTNELYTTLYTKPTDTRDFLHYNSAHPFNTKKGGPYGQFLRMRRICTKDLDFARESRSLYLAYTRRGYPSDILEAHLYKASSFSQNELLVTKPKAKNTRQVFVTTFNPQNPNIMGSIKLFWPILQTSKTLRRIFPDPPMCAFRRPRNLKDMLVKATTQYPPPTPLEKPEVIPLRNTTCPKITCVYCKYLDKNKTATSSVLGITLKCKVYCRISCLTPNVVYLITCLKCNLQYVGETKRPLQKRIYEHMRTINKFGSPGIQSTPVSEHFNNNCSRPARLRFQILETIRGDPTSIETLTHRRKRELWWILNLRTLDPLGINIQS